MSYGNTLAVSPDGDLVINTLGRLEIISGPEKAAQDLTIILRSLRGSYRLNTMFGTDHLPLVNTPNAQALIRHEVHRALRTYPYLRSVEQITVQVNEQRAVSVAVQATLTGGETLSLGVTL